MYLFILFDGGFLDSAKRRILGRDALGRDFRIAHDRLAQEILAKIQGLYGPSVIFSRAYYYDCYPYDEELKRGKESFFNYLRQLPRFDVRIGRLRPTTIDLEVKVINYDALSADQKETLAKTKFSIALYKKEKAQQDEAEDEKKQEIQFTLDNLLGSKEITFRRYRQKGTDIQICTDMLALAQRNGANGIICLLSNDTDFIPVIDEVKRTGSQVVLAYFERIGVTPELWHACDERIKIEEEFMRKIIISAENKVS